MKTPRELIEHVPQIGRLEWIGLRPARGAPVVIVPDAQAIEGRGLDGDRTAAKESRGRGTRQVTLIGAEHLEVIAKLLGRGAIDPALLRRNLVISGINPFALARRRFAVGGCVLEGTGECHPCSKMEAALGDGGYAAMRGHGGILARVHASGTLCVGDAVRALPIRPE